MTGFKTLSIKLNPNNLTLEEIDKRAEELGINRSQFTALALQTLINFDLNFWKKIQSYSEGLNQPEWLIIQNMLIKRFAREDAEVQVFERKSKMLYEFMNFHDEAGPRVLTGKELYDTLKERYVCEFERELHGNHKGVL